MRAIERSPMPGTSLRESLVQPRLAIVRTQPQYTTTLDRWFAAAMFGITLLFATAFAKFVIDPALQTVIQPASAGITEGP